MNNYIIIYDGTFINLLTTIKYLLQANIKPQKIVIEGTYSPSLFETIIKPNIDNDPTFITKITKSSSKEVLKLITYTFLSNVQNKELVLYYLILNTFIYKDKIIYQRNLNCVNTALKLAHRVSSENHKMKGFTRFKVINNKFLYTEISPDNNILDLLSKHFQKRLKNELWIIKDTNRNILSIYDLNTCHIDSGENIKLLALENNKNDNYYENLWCIFFKTIAIKERKNQKCQMSFMPKKYWHNIIEMEDYNAKSN